MARRRSAPHLLLGVFLTLVAAVAFAVTSLRMDPRIEVLALAGPVSAGQVLGDADLVVARIVPDSTIAVLPADRRTSVVGRTVTMPLPANSLLSEEALGRAAWPPNGQSVIAAAVKAGRAPDGVSAGARVLVLVVPPASSTATISGAPPDGPRAAATVVAVQSADASGSSVVSLLMSSADALRIAGANGDVALVLQGGPS